MKFYLSFKFSMGV